MVSLLFLLNENAGTLGVTGGFTGTDADGLTAELNANSPCGLAGTAATVVDGVNEKEGATDAVALLGVLPNNG